MATVAPDVTLGDSGVTITEVPWFVRKLYVTSGTTAAAIAHGGPAAAPDLVFGTQTNAGTPDGGFVCSAKSTTTITLDFSDDGNDIWEVYYIWFGQTTGGIS